MPREFDKALKQGLYQQGLEDQIAKSLGGSGFGLYFGGAVGLLFAKLFTPNIETIFDKMYVEILKSAGLKDIDRFLTGPGYKLGSGIGDKGRETLKTYKPVNEQVRGSVEFTAPSSGPGRKTPRESNGSSTSS